MPTPTSKGVLVKARRDWNVDVLAGATVLLNPVAAQFPYAALFNDSSPSVDLAVYALSLWQANANDHVDVRWLFGQLPGATFVSQGNPVVAGGPVLPGSFYSLISASVFGTLLLELSGPAGWFFTADESPLVIVPPGYSLVFKGNTAQEFAVFNAIWAPYP